MKYFIFRAIENYDWKVNGTKLDISATNPLEDYGPLLEKMTNAAQEYWKRLNKMCFVGFELHSHRHGGGEKPFEFHGGGSGIAIGGLSHIDAPDGHVNTFGGDDIEGSYLATTIDVDESELWTSITGDEGDDLEDPLSLVYYEPKDDLENRTVPRPPQIKSRQADALNLRSFLFHFDSKYLNLHHISELTAYAESIFSEGSKRAQKVSLFCLLLVHTGIEPKMLLQLYADQDSLVIPDASQHPLVVRQEGESFVLFRFVPKTYKKDQISFENCYKVVSFIKIQLPRSLNDYIKTVWPQYSESGYLFALHQPYKAPSFNLDDVKRHLNVLSAKKEWRLTPHGLAASFFAVYVARYGLDPIIAAFISGQHLRLYQTQMHYIFLSLYIIAQEYQMIAQIVEQKIEANRQLQEKFSDVLSDSQDVRITIHPVTCQRFLAQDMTECCSGIGSPIVPLKEHLEAYISNLKNKIVRTGPADIIQRHNLYTYYMLLCAQFNFALRARNDIPFSFNTFATDEHEIISDKQSRSYFEERILPVSDSLRTLVTNFRNYFPEVTNIIGARLNPAYFKFTPDKLIFFLDKYGNPTPFSLAKCKSILIAAGVDYPFHDRMPRHYVRTYFYWNKIAHDIADCWLGHHRIFKEPMGISSSLVYDDIAKIGLPLIEDLLKEIGLTPISYCPSLP